MHRECRERFPRHRLQRKPLVSDPSMHHGTCVMHVPWYMSGSLTRGGGENVPGSPGACATRNFAYLVRGPGPSTSKCVRFVTFQWITYRIQSWWPRVRFRFMPAMLLLFSLTPLKSLHVQYRWFIKHGVIVTEALQSQSQRLSWMCLDHHIRYQVPCNLPWTHFATNPQQVIVRCRVW